MGTAISQPHQVGRNTYNPAISSKLNSFNEKLHKRERLAVQSGCRVAGVQMAPGFWDPGRLQPGRCGLACVATNSSLRDLYRVAMQLLFLK